MMIVDVLKAVVVITSLTSAPAASGASGGVKANEQQFHRAPDADLNVTCVLGHSCSLPCRFNGQFKDGSWKRHDKPYIPIVVEPPIEMGHRHKDYKNISSLSVQQPGDGAVLIISDVQLKHQGLHQCTVTSTSEEVNYFVDLHVHSPVLIVSLHQEGQELLCSSEGIYPKPTLTWTPPFDSKPQTSVNETEDGLFTISSAVRLPRGSAGKNYTCNISTVFSSNSSTLLLDAVDPKLDYLWILLLLLVPAVLLIYFREKLCKKDTSTSGDAVAESRMPLHHQNGLPNGLNHETSVLQMNTSV